MRLRLVPDKTSINFFRASRIWLTLSILGVVAALILVPVRGLNFGVDFQGGTLILAEVPGERSVAEYRELVAGLGLGAVAVTEASGGSGGQVILLRISDADEAALSQGDVVGAVRAALDAAYPGVVYLQVDSVGSKVSGELVRNGVIATVLALAAIMIYVWLRFEWQFALGAVASLFHDVIVTVGVFALFQLEFDLTVVAGLLTIIGYSVNDTVVVFDRVRENLRKYKKMPLDELLNLALNETLSRTVMTSSTVLIALLALLFLGGPVTWGFAFAVTFGVLIGTYSSIYVASAIVLWLGVKRDWSKADPTAVGGRVGKTEA
jgi:preprotein translocase SecF subunit